MPVTPDQIVATAMRLLERDGIEGVSFRKIGAELGVSAPTLYWHVDSKRRLLDLMAEALMAESHRRESHDPRRGEPWWAWLERRTTAMYETLISHRDAPRVVAGNRPTVTALPAIETTLATLVDAGFEPAEAIEVVVMLGAFATGCALELQAEAERGIERHTGELGTAIRAGHYPTIVKAFTAHHERSAGASPHDQMFEHGLRMIVTGLRASLAERSHDEPEQLADLEIRASDFADDVRGPRPTADR